MQDKRTKKVIQDDKHKTPVCVGIVMPWLKSMFFDFFDSMAWIKWENSEEIWHDGWAKRPEGYLLALWMNLNNTARNWVIHHIKFPQYLPYFIQAIESKKSKNIDLSHGITTMQGCSPLQDARKS